MNLFFLLSTILLSALLFSGCSSTAIPDTLKSAEDGLKSLAKMMEPSKPEGRRIQETKLYKLFESYPIDGKKKDPVFAGELWFPRVALIPVTVPSEHLGVATWGEAIYHGSEIPGYEIQKTRTGKGKDPIKVCWTYEAKIWYSNTKSEDVPAFIYCAEEARKKVLFGGPEPTYFFNGVMPWDSKQSSGSVHTRGPKQPTQFAPPNFYSRQNRSSHGSYRQIAMVGMLIDMGLDPQDTGEGNRVWVSQEKYTVKDF